MPVLPFHRYIGPGNPIDSGPCVDDDDCIARKHDVKYENATTEKEIRLADVEAINEFRTNWKSGNWHSFIGDVGLSVKYCVETYTGVLYPKLGETPACEIVHLFNDLLTLHCVNKLRGFDRYHREPGKLYDFTSYQTKQSVETFFYVLVAWYQLNSKNNKLISRSDLQTVVDKPSSQNLCENCLLTASANVTIDVLNSAAVEHCNIFHLKGWLRALALFHGTVAPVRLSDYNDEEFSNLFLQYD